MYIYKGYPGAMGYYYIISIKLLKGDKFETCLRSPSQAKPPLYRQVHPHLPYLSSNQELVRPISPNKQVTPLIPRPCMKSFLNFLFVDCLSSALFTFPFVRFLSSEQFLP